MSPDAPNEPSSSESSDPTIESFWQFVHSIDFDGAPVQSVNPDQIAQSMLETAMREHPEHASLLKDRSAALHWWMPRTVRDIVYRDHFRELLQRIMGGTALPPATRAEVLTILCDLGKRDQLSKQTASVLGWLFAEVTGLRYPGIIQLIELQTDIERNDALAQFRKELQFVFREVLPAFKNSP